MASDLFHEGDGVKVVDWKNAKIASATLDLVRKLFNEIIFVFIFFLCQIIFFKIV